MRGILGGERSSRRSLRRGGQLRDERFVLRKESGQFAALRQLEILEVKPRRHGAADQAEVGFRRKEGSKPVPRFHQMTEGLTIVDRVAEACPMETPFWIDLDNTQRPAQIE